MKVITVSDANITPNMVRGAFFQKKVSGIDLLGAHSEAELLSLVDEHSVVLIDWEMEPTQGVKMVSAVKEKLSAVPILLLCLKSKAGTTFGAVKAGASGVVYKPFVPDDLVASIAAVIKKGQQAIRPTVNVEFINPFMDGARNVFSQMCGIEIQRKKIFLKDDYKMMGDISGVMELSGAAMGSVVVSMSRQLACMVVGNMLGEPPAESLTPGVKDAIGEIINMIAGQAKAALVKTKYHFSISIPKVIDDPGMEIAHQPGSPNIIVLYEGVGMDFALQVCLAPNYVEEPEMMNL